MVKNLKEKAITGVAWSGIHKLATVLLNFISGIVLARLLMPSDYGVIGMLTIFLAVSNTFIDAGFGSALIQKKRPTDTDYSTILFWNLGLSVFLYCVLYFCAPTIARFYGVELIRDVLRVQGLVLIINAARIVQRNQLRKQLKFKKITIINFSSSFLSLILTIYLAWRGIGVWALVVQQLCVGFLNTTFYWISSKWRPILTFSTKSFKELFNFGGFILLSNLVNTLCNNIQGLMIGKMYNPATMGYYSKAHRVEGLASTFISSVLDQVSYPVLSETQNDRSMMIRVLRKAIGTSAFFTFPTLLLLILLAKPVFLLLYSERWLECVPYFQIICIGGISICLQNINYYAVAALGKSKLLFKWTLFKRLVGLILIVLGMWLHGIYGLLFASVITAWMIYLINASLAAKYVGYKKSQQFADLMPIMALALLSFTLAWLVGRGFHLGLYTDALIMLVVFACTYLGVANMFKMNALLSSKETIMILIHKVRKKDGH